MEKTIYSGDTFICDQHAYRKQPPARGDVIVFHHHGDLILVKRLIGLEGDRIEGKDGVVSVNGKVLNEPYAQHEGQSVDNLDNFGPKTVAPGEVFVLGDNRNRSLDSRLPEFGEVQQTDIMGKALYVVKSNHGQNGQSIR
jgi:signal peptidase I